MKFRFIIIMNIEKFLMKRSPVEYHFISFGCMDVHKNITKAYINAFTFTNPFVFHFTSIFFTFVLFQFLLFDKSFWQELLSGLLLDTKLL